MSCPIKILNDNKLFCFELWGFDNDYLSFEKINNNNNNNKNTDNKDENNENGIFQCNLYYTYNLLSRLADMYIKHKSD
jgi:hypothetical protein